MLIYKPNNNNKIQNLKNQENHVLQRINIMTIIKKRKVAIIWVANRLRIYLLIGISIERTAIESRRAKASITGCKKFWAVGRNRFRI